MVRLATWLVSLTAHSLLVTVWLGGALSQSSPALEVGTGDDVFKIEQGIGVEGLEQQGVAVETVEATEAPQQVSEARPQIDEVKPVETEVIASKEGAEQDDIPLQEEKPEEVKQEQPPQVATLEQPETVAVEEQKAAGAKQEGGDAGVKSAYLGKVHTRLQRSKVNPRSRATGTVLIRFAVAPTGQLLSREVVTSSGSQVLDEAAIAAIEKAAPFPSFPPDLKLDKIVEVVPYRFSVR